MDVGKLKRTLQREFQRSPAKTCVLLSLLPIAGYFIGPLAWKFVRPGKTPAVAEASSIQAPASSPAIAIAAGATGGAPAVTWKDAATWMEMDSLMRAAVPLVTRNPFRSTLNEQDIANAKNAKSDRQLVNESAIASDARPEELGLRLTATIVGNRIRMATINGKQYKENALIAVTAANASPEELPTVGADAFVLKLVDRKYVILERDGKTYQLPLAR